MHLKTYLKALPDEPARDAFADRCGTTPGHLRNVANGKSCGPALAMAIELESRGAVMRWEMRPTDWHLIWAELRKRKGAPEAPAQAEQAGA